MATCTFVISAFKRLKQEDNCMFVLVYMVNSRPARATVTVSKTNKNSSQKLS